MKTAKKKPLAKTITIPPNVMSVMSVRQIAAALDVAPRQVWRLISAGKFPPSESPAGQDPRWRVTTFNEWVENTYGKR